MPVYEYVCDEGHEFEWKQHITAEPVEFCLYYTDDAKPATSRCRAPCRRLISNTSFKFKGGPPTPKYHT
jgi:predicted nucleic acid-binding Zn ribbon protein